MSGKQFRRLEINGGQVKGEKSLRLITPVTASGYIDAQIDDYGPTSVGQKSHRRDYPWRPAVTMHLRACFSHPVGQLRGTAGFGFWNAPFGDPTVAGFALPQACWFFYASSPSDLPLAPAGTGRGWFAATVDATTGRAWSMAPLAPIAVLLNQVDWLRRRIWPAVRRRLGMAYAPLEFPIEQWHTYELSWRPDGCSFIVDGQIELQTNQAPRGPLGFVCWLDNQYLVLTNRGRINWGVLPIRQEQWLKVKELQVQQLQHAAS
jgi:hypothetical protein